MKHLLLRVTKTKWPPDISLPIQWVSVSLALVMFLNSPVFGQSSGIVKSWFSEGASHQYQVVEQEPDGPPATSTITYASLGQSRLEATVVEKREGELNPYQLSYQYEIEQLGNGGFKLGMQAVIEPFLMYVSPDAEVTYDQDMIEYPGELTEGAMLPEYTGNIQIDLGEMDMTHQIVIRDRQCHGNMSINLNGQTYEAVYISGTYSRVSLLRGEEFSRLESSIHQWIVPGIGIVKQSIGSTDWLLLQ